MVEFDKLNVGDKVHYQPVHYGADRWENGIVKSKPGHTTHGVFVVYNCAGNWDKYQQYTAAMTVLSDLHYGWKYKQQPKPQNLFEEERHGDARFSNTRWHGEVYDEKRDKVRLNAMVLAIFNLMKDGRWVTKHDLVAVCKPGTSDETASRAMRSLRHKENGRHSIRKQRVADSNLWAYQLTINPNWPYYDKSETEKV
jgi:hypothetical protein